MMHPSDAASWRECTRCVMNNHVDRSLSFDEHGVCHHCTRYDALVGSRMIDPKLRETSLAQLVDEIRRAGKGRPYDCLIGVSGGVDSSFVAHLVRQHGLRPLAIHVDNGWNSELAVDNIHRLLSQLNIDLVTEVLDWEEFSSLQVAFLRASTPDGEVPTDHAIAATLWRAAAKHGIKHIISGMNFATESISVPDWSYGHSDGLYIADVNRRFGRSKLKSFPSFSLPYLGYLTFIRRIKSVSILNYVDYVKSDALRILKNEYGWREYGGKHYESIYTRFYQGYILPQKFGVDKRFGHASDLINAGQITKYQAKMELREPTYAEALQTQDIDYVCKKLRLSVADFESIMKAPVKSFRDYRNQFSRVARLKVLVNRLRALGIYPK